MLDVIYRKNRRLVLDKEDIRSLRGVATDVAGTIIDSRKTSLGIPWPGAVDFLFDLHSLFGPLAVIEHAIRFQQVFGKSFHDFLDGPELKLTEVCPPNLRLECGYVTPERPDGYKIAAKQLFNCRYEELMVITDHYPHALGALYARAGLVVLSCPPAPYRIGEFWRECREYFDAMPKEDYFARDNSRIAVVDGLRSIQFDPNVLDLFAK